MMQYHTHTRPPFTGCPLLLPASFLTQDSGSESPFLVHSALLTSQNMSAVSLVPSIHSSHLRVLYYCCVCRMETSVILLRDVCEEKTNKAYLTTTVPLFPVKAWRWKLHEHTASVRLLRWPLCLWNASAALFPFLRLWTAWRPSLTLTKMAAWKTTRAVFHEKTVFSFNASCK